MVLKPDKVSGSAPDLAEANGESAEEKPSYGQILKSSALIGGSSVLVIAVGIVRTKVMALLLGPAGLGLMALYSSIVDVVMSVAGMGVGQSGVRQIADANGSGEQARIATTITVLRRLSLWLGIIGGILLVVFSPQVSALTFGSDARTAAVALLALAVLFRVVNAGQAALVQGLRRIGDLALMGVYGALLGTLASIALIYVMGEEGIAPSVVAVAGATLLVSWWYSRRVRIETPDLSLPVIREESASLLKLGFAFMASGFLMMGSAYAVRAIVLQSAGLDAAGFYQAAWTLGGLYVTMILQAMAADFYPRLTAAARDDRLTNRLVNEQAHVSMLMAAPGVIATLVLAPLLMVLFYTSEFDAAAGLLRWICLGMALRIITWPMGYIIVARGEQTLFFATELAWAIANVGLTWWLVQRYGLNGAGMGFFGSYALHALLIYPVVRRVSGFRWTLENVRLGAAFLAVIFVVLGALSFLSPAAGMAAGILTLIVVTFFCLKAVASLVSFAAVPTSVRWVLVKFRLIGRQDL